ncbi:MAG: hypothetical protein RLZZ66_906 [Pseudomonadota bacterium]|jgi:hypothetical protein
MIQIQIIDPSVLAALEAAFPKKPNAVRSNAKLLASYTKKLEQALDEAELRGNYSLNINLGLYGIYLHDLQNNTPQMGSKSIRLHAWLEQNNLKLIHKEQEGQKHGSHKGPSLVKPTARIKITDVDDRLDPQSAFTKLHPNFHKLSQQEIDTDYYCCEVDVESVNNFIQPFANLLAQNIKFNIKDRTVYLQAKRIAAAASWKNNIYYQKKKHSDFGRTYYEGLSVQNIRKDLREAMLGDCWEYDMRSSVVAWKLGFAQDYINQNNLSGSIQSIFPQCHQYWSNKSVLIDAIRADVFTDGFYNDEKQIGLIKDAMTALNFGARRSAGMYFDQQGNQCRQAIGEIFKDDVERDTFLQSQIIIDFVAEQKILNDTIINMVKANQPYILSYSFLRDTESVFKRLKLLAYLYQSAETEVMNIVRSYANTNNLTILANVHDAIVLKDQLSPSIKLQIDSAIQASNPFWFLKETKYNRTP